jgi:hypothetical protein
MNPEPTETRAASARTPARSPPRGRGPMRELLPGLLLIAVLPVQQPIA